MALPRVIALAVGLALAIPALAQEISRGVAVPAAVAADLKLDGAKSQVVVYYANETLATENLTRLAGWLTDTDDARMKKIGDRLRNDAKDFSATVAAETEALRLAAKTDTTPFGVAVFTNALARKGEFLYLPVGAADGKYLTGKLALPRFTSPILADAPLTGPQGLAAALAATASVFPGEKHAFLLVTKSHGNSNEVLAPMLARHYDAEDKAKVLADLAKGLKRRDEARATWASAVKAVPGLSGDKMDNPILSGDKMDNPILLADKDNILAVPESTSASVLRGTGATEVPLTPADSLLLDLSGERFVAEAVQAAAGPRPTARAYLSVPKPVYLSVIRAAGQELGMRFPVVFAESCRSEVSKAMIAWLRERPNVGNLYTSDMDGLKYTTIDYAKLFAAKPGATAAEKLDAALVAKHEADKAEREKRRPKK